MCSKTIYPINCTCCDPAKLLKNFNAKKYHLNKMAKKRSADDAADAPSVNIASVNIFVVIKSFN
jgi:hypothetical protein